MNFCKLAKLSSVALIMATAANAENVLRRTSQGDALPMDPHSQNESPTITFNAQNKGLVTFNTPPTSSENIAIVL